MSIYLSDWNPRGVRKSFERCAVANEDAQHLLRDFGEGQGTDACGWFDEDGRLRILVADTDTGRRFTARNTKRHWSVNIDYTRAAESQP